MDEELPYEVMELLVSSLSFVCYHSYYENVGKFFEWKWSLGDLGRVLDGIISKNTLTLNLVTDNGITIKREPGSLLLARKQLLE